MAYYAIEISVWHFAYFVVEAESGSEAEENYLKNEGFIQSEDPVDNWDEVTAVQKLKEKDLDAKEAIMLARYGEH